MKDHKKNENQVSNQDVEAMLHAVLQEDKLLPKHIEGISVRLDMTGIKPIDVNKFRQLLEQETARKDVSVSIKGQTIPTGTSLTIKVIRQQLRKLFSLDGFLMLISGYFRKPVFTGMAGVVIGMLISSCLPGHVTFESQAVRDETNMKMVQEVLKLRARENNRFPLWLPTNQPLTKIEVSLVPSENKMSCSYLVTTSTQQQHNK